MNRKTLLGVILLVALLAPSAAVGATGYQIREVKQGGAVVLWGDRAGNPYPSCDAAARNMGFIRNASAQTSTVTCEAYAGGTLRKFNLDR